MRQPIGDAVSGAPGFPTRPDFAILYVYYCPSARQTSKIAGKAGRARVEGGRIFVP